MFEITKKSSDSKARTGILNTLHGDIKTPAFTVVGTKATVKGIDVNNLIDIKAQAILVNTYHLLLQPGEDVVAKNGGVGKFMGWSGPTFSDSGGFQVFSLGAAFGEKVSKVATAELSFHDGGTNNPNRKAKISEDGVEFQSHIDGQKLKLTPERSMEVQWKLGADVIFAFDECTSPVATYEYQREAMDRTHRWAQRSFEAHNSFDTTNIQSLFAVVQGGRHEDLRRESAKTLASMNFDGFGIGGSFNKEDLASAVGWVTDELPEEKPKHLLGIGEPGDIINGVIEGCDTFDCVAPTRIARNGSLYTSSGMINIMNSKFKDDSRKMGELEKSSPIAEYSLAYIAHLFRANEMLGPILASIHNVAFMLKLMENIRGAIENDKLREFQQEFRDSFY